MKFRYCLGRKKSTNNIVFLQVRNLVSLVLRNSPPDHSQKLLIPEDPTDPKNKMKRRSEKSSEKYLYWKEMHLKAQGKNKFQKKYVF